MRQQPLTSSIDFTVFIIKVEEKSTHTALEVLELPLAPRNGGLKGPINRRVVAGSLSDIHSSR